MTDSKPRASKRDVANHLLRRGNMFMHLDPRVAGVDVPVHLRKQTRTAFHVGLNMPIPIMDMVVDDVGIRATLSFNQAPYLCKVPWPAVFALIGDDERGMVWEEAFPAELVKSVEKMAVGWSAEELGEALSEPAPVRPGLRLVK